jgi:hypothetical protein
VKRRNDRTAWLAGCPPALERCLRAYDARRVRNRCMLRLLNAAAAALVALGGGLALDRLVDAGSWTRLALLVAFAAAAVAGLIGAAAAALAKRPEPETLAGEIDRLSNRSDDTLRSAVNFLLRSAAGEHIGHSFLVKRTVKEAAETAQKTEPGCLCPSAPAWHRLALAAVLGGILLALSLHPAMPMPLMLKRFFNPFGNYPRPSWTLIQTDAPPTISLEAGSDLEVRASLAGRIPEAVECTLAVLGASGENRRVPLQPMPDGTFRGLVPNVREDFAFVIEAGDGRTARHKVLVLHPPEVISMTAHYRPPRYARLENRTESVRYRQISALTGTAVEIEFELNAPVAEAVAVLETTGVGGEPRGEESATAAGQPGGERLERLIKEHSGTDKPRAITRTLPVSLSKDRRQGVFEFRIEQSGLLRLNLNGANGVSNRFAPAYKVTAIPDNPPSVSIVNLTEEVSARADDILRVSYHVRDDFGIADLQYRASTGSRTEGGMVEFIPLDKFGEKEVEGEVAIPLRELAPESIYLPSGGQHDVVVDFSLVAVDLKGQTSNSRRVRITVLRDTYDRQMRELLEVMGDLAQSTSRNLADINKAVNSLTVLCDSLAPDTPWTPDHQKRLDDVANRLKFGLFPDYQARQRYEAYRFTFYPYRAQRAADVFFCLALAQTVDCSALSKLGESPEGRSRLREALETLNRRQAFLRDFDAALRASIRELKFDMMLYLVELSREELSRFAEGGNEFTELLKERLAARAAVIADIVRELQLAEYSEKLNEASEQLRQASTTGNLDGLRDALLALRSEILSNEQMVAAGSPPSDFEHKYDDAWLMEQGRREAALSPGSDPFALARSVWSEALQASQDAQVTDDPLLAGRALASLRLASGMKDEKALLEPIQALRPHGRAWLSACLLNQASLEGKRMLGALDAGSIAPADGQARALWERFRDMALVAMETAEPFCESLRPYRPLAIRWDLADIWNDRNEQEKLRQLATLLEQLAYKAAAQRPLAAVNTEEFLTEGCARLADLLERKRQEALRHMDRLREEAQLPPPKDAEEARQRNSVANYAFGVAEEQTLAYCGTVHRKLYDLWEARAVTTGELQPDASLCHAATVQYMWWLTSDVALFFGRYHGPSVVRRHDETPQAYLERMKDYPDNLALGSAAFRQLASGAAVQQNIMDDMTKRAASALDLKHEREDIEAFRASLAALQGTDVQSAASALKAAAGDRTAGAFVTELIVIPLRRAIAELQSEEPLDAIAPAVNRQGAAAASVASIVEALPNKEEILSFAAMLSGTPPAKLDRQDALTMAGRCIETLSPRLQLPQFTPVVSKRLEKESRMNYYIYHCLERSHRLWQREAVEQHRLCERERVGLLARRAQGGGIGEAWRCFALQFAHLRIAQRKSHGVQREAGGTLDVNIPGMRYDLLVMPKHLYEELIRAQEEPYPEQFKEQGKSYLRGLVEDARK